MKKTTPSQDIYSLRPVTCTDSGETLPSEAAPVARQKAAAGPPSGPNDDRTRVVKLRAILESGQGTPACA